MEDIESDTTLHRIACTVSYPTTPCRAFFIMRRCRISERGGGGRGLYILFRDIIKTAITPTITTTTTSK